MENSVLKILEQRNQKHIYLKITEIEAPETYTKLRDTIELKVTTKLYEETEKAKYVLDNIELISGENDGLVKLVKNTEDKIELEVTNNQFDLALRKYISSINGEDISRWTKPEVDTSKLITGEEATAEYYNAKAPLRIYKEQEVIYTLRIYNEGQIDGYATEITDYLPEGFEAISAQTTQWVVNGNEVKTNSLNKNLLQPGESKSIFIECTYKVNKENIGSKINSVKNNRI